MSKAIFILTLLLSLISCQSYRKLHNEAIVVDTHNDVLSIATMRGLSIENDLTGQTHSDISRFKKGGVDIQVFSIFCDERFGKDTAYAYANREIDSLYAIVGRNPDMLMMVKSLADVEKAVAEKKMGCMIGVEGGHMIEDRMDYLEALYNRGARYLTLTWNNSTSWASSAWDEVKGGDTLQRKGLNDLGKGIVRRMNELGMLVDVSHVGEKTFYDVIATTSKPVIASHSCVYSLCPVPRNLKDDQIRAIGRNKGVIQLNFYSGFLDSNYNKRMKALITLHQKEWDSLKNLKMANYEIEEWISKKYSSETNALRSPLSLLLDHLDYIVRLIGVDGVGLGSDFDGIESPPQTLDDVTTYPLITRALKKRGYSDGDIMKILGGNFLRVLKENEHR